MCALTLPWLVLPATVLFAELLFLRHAASVHTIGWSPNAPPKQGARASVVRTGIADRETHAAHGYWTLAAL
jgi:hypothetical protein